MILKNWKEHRRIDEGKDSLPSPIPGNIIL